MSILNKFKLSYFKSYIDYKYNNYLMDKKYRIYKNDKKFIMIGTPDHGNLGDHAITQAQYKFLDDNFKNYKTIELDLNEYYSNIDFIKKYINSDDIIIINGGGNFGDEYLFDENIRRNAIKAFINNKIILFPQTIYFKENEKGKKELEISKSIYNNHKDLTLVAREKVSYEKMKKEFNKCNVILTPDIVLYLNEEINNQIRSGALCCLRSDLESKLSENQKKFIANELKDKFKEISITDTVINKSVSKIERDKILKSKFNEFRNSELVITDRIHGMIFAAITGTPCIALSNYNYKVKGTYEWIKNLGYIKFTDDINEIPTLIQELKSVKKKKYDNSFAIKKYQQIVQCINS